MVDCKYLEAYQICSDGGYIDRNYQYLDRVADDKDRTISEACCICGGGLKRNSFQDKLRHWMIAIYGRVDPAHFVTASPSSSSIVFSNPTMTQGSLSSIQSNPFSPSYLPTEMTAATPQPTDAPTILPHSPTFRESSHPTNMRSFLSSTMPSWNLNPNPPMSILEQSSGPLISS